jgi:RND family efflux transporter MFP subunit
MSRRRYPICLALVLVAASTVACGRGETAATLESPSAVEAADGGGQQLRLAPEAVARLGIETQEARRQPMPEYRTYGGALAIPAGKAITVAAPIAGILSVPAHGGGVRAGARIAAGTAVFAIRPMAPPDQDLLRLEAEAVARVAAARARAERSEQLLRDRVGSVRDVEQAQADLSVQETQLAQARAQLAQLNRRGDGADVTFEVQAPIDGRVMAVPVGVGQLVERAAPLFSISDDRLLWVRVPVYVGDLALIDSRAEALVGAALTVAKPIQAPPSADAAAGTVDLFYELANAGGSFFPGQRVDAALVLGTSMAEQLVVPRSALLYDTYGVAWVYANPEPGLFRRVQVAVARVAGDLAVLDDGPALGTRIVTLGAAELYGTESGVGH